MVWVSFTDLVNNLNVAVFDSHVIYTKVTNGICVCLPIINYSNLQNHVMLQCKSFYNSVINMNINCDLFFVKKFYYYSTFTNNN